MNLGVDLAHLDAEFVGAVCAAGAAGRGSGSTKGGSSRTWSIGTFLPGALGIWCMAAIGCIWLNPRR
ncbi:hypothetical protein RBB78_05790 [Tunturiibacter empetritectus]|uniref:hypothetical protein n=1 Tax=Tunturiibacter empetritectus TaxID=3069691 RepID=UPI003D9BBD82